MYMPEVMLAYEYIAHYEYLCLAKSSTATTAALADVRRIGNKNTYRFFCSDLELKG
jgi:hypothetical protein